MVAECDMTGLSAVIEGLAEPAREGDGFVTFEASADCSLISIRCVAVPFDLCDNDVRAMPLTGDPSHLVPVLFCLPRTSRAML